MVNNLIEKAIKVVSSLKTVEEKIEYIQEVIEIKSIDERIIFLEELNKKIKDQELNKLINVILTELKFNEEISAPARFPSVEEEEKEEFEIVKQNVSLENVVQRERPEETGAPKEYFTSPSTIYESTMMENTPLLSNIKKDLEMKGLLREGETPTTSQRVAMMEEMQKYSPASSPERLSDYFDLLTGRKFEKYESGVKIGIRDMFEEKEKHVKYKKLEAKQ